MKLIGNCPWTYQDYSYKSKEDCRNWQRTIGNHNSVREMFARRIPKALRLWNFCHTPRGRGVESKSIGVHLRLKLGVALRVSVFRSRQLAEVEAHHAGILARPHVGLALRSG